MEGCSKLEKKELQRVLQEFGSALAENLIPLTFFVGGEVEFGRVDIMNQTEPGKLLKSMLIKETSTLFNVPEDDVDELLITYYLMINGSVLVEHTAHSVATGVYQPSIDRGVFTLDEDEIRLMYKLHGIEEIPEKAWRDLSNAVSGIPANYNIDKIKAVRLDWQKCKTTNPRSLMNYDDGVHIIPCDVIVGYSAKLRELARTSFLKLTYKKVNTTNRVQYVTLNQQIINEVYKKDLRFANDFFERCTPTPFQYHGNYTFFDTLQGFWRVGDLGISRFVYNGNRHISLSRLTEIKLGDNKEFEEVKKYVDVDLDNVVDLFIHYISRLDKAGVDRVMRDLDCQNTDLIQFVQAQVTIFSTTYQKRLHDYMSTNQELFNGYTGIKDNQFGNAYNMQGSDIQFGSTEEIDF